SRRVDWQSRTLHFGMSRTIAFQDRLAHDDVEPPVCCAQMITEKIRPPSPANDPDKLWRVDGLRKKLGPEGGKRQDDPQATTTDFDWGESRCPCRCGCVGARRPTRFNCLLQFTD